MNNVNIAPEVYTVVYHGVPAHAYEPRSANAPQVYDHPWDAIEARKSLAEMQLEDIANKEVRPDVYHAVVKLLPAIPERRRAKEAPQVFDHPWDEIEANKAKAEKEFLDEQAAAAKKSAELMAKIKKEQEEIDAKEDARAEANEKREKEMEEQAKGPEPSKLIKTDKKADKESPKEDKKKDDKKADAPKDEKKEDAKLA